MDKLLETTQKFPNTDYWNDSCAKSDLEYAIARGAVGATTNPIIVGSVFKRETDLWKDRVYEIIGEKPSGSEEDVAWKLIEEMGARGAGMLKSIYDKYKGKKGRISIQTNARHYRNTEAMVTQAKHFNTLAPNMQVKMPASAAGIKAFEEATYAGISINATVSFTVPQAIAVAEAVERGFARREAEGLPIDTMAPVCTLMVGRADDWLKAWVARTGVIVDPDCLEYVGVAIFKRAYKIYKEKGYRLRLLAAAFRNHYHWSEFIGGDCAMTITQDWQEKLNASNVEVVSRIDKPVPPVLLDQLLTLPEFVKAYEPDGQAPEEFEHYGAFVHTLSTFLDGYDDLLKTIRPYMVKE
ncbi:MAG: transaldolase [Oscillospiraceae bacterium]|nr:transaldolase [Oscillospiraceae bacterium]